MPILQHLAILLVQWPLTSFFASDSWNSRYLSFLWVQRHSWPQSVHRAVKLNRLLKKLGLKIPVFEGTWGGVATESALCHDCNTKTSCVKATNKNIITKRSTILGISEEGSSYLPGGCSLGRCCCSAPGCLGFLLGGFDNATEICLSPTRAPSSATMADDAPVCVTEVYDALIFS